MIFTVFVGYMANVTNFPILTSYTVLGGHMAKLSNNFIKSISMTKYQDFLKE